MGFHSIPGTNHQYGLIAFDAQGNERLESSGQFSQKLINEAARLRPTDVFFFSHGWKGDVPAAIEQYDSWIGALVKSGDFDKAPNVFSKFQPLFIGLHWPSLPWGNEEAGADGAFAADGGGSPNPLLNDYVERLGGGSEIRGLLEIIFKEARHNISPDTLPSAISRAYSDLNKALGLDSEGVAAPPDADREGFDPEEAYQAANEEAANFGALNLGGLLGPLRQLSYWTMKKRARTIGEGGMHAFLKELQVKTSADRTRIHLMGHSFGTIVISGMLNGPEGKGSLSRSVDSVALIQGAVSLWSYAAMIPFSNRGSGYFSGIIKGKKVAGPLITTKSRYDKAVGNFYPLASRIHGSASFAPGELPEFGAVGAYGLQGLGDAIQRDISMVSAQDSHNFEPGRVYNLESSGYIRHGDGASGAHSDIAGPEVAHAIWEAAFVAARQPKSVSQ